MYNDDSQYIPEDPFKHFVCLRMTFDTFFISGHSTGLLRRLSRRSLTSAERQFARNVFSPNRIQPLSGKIKALHLIGLYRRNDHFAMIQNFDFIPSEKVPPRFKPTGNGQIDNAAFCRIALEQILVKENK